MTNSVNRPDVAILLATFQGAAFLGEQLASIERQTYSHWRLYVSDDGSTDATSCILRQFQGKIGSARVHAVRGPGNGYVSNFLSLICDPGIEAPFYAFADQDDVWRPEKLSRGLEFLNSVPADVPALYCSRTLLIDGVGREIGRSPHFGKRPSFSNAIVQNIAGGNTMIFNRAARRYLVGAGQNVDIPSHDWWLYLVTTAVGGRVCYDPYCSIEYRIHDNNIIGTNIGIRPRLHRVKMLVGGRFRQWNDMHIAQLNRIREHLTEDNKRILDSFCSARSQGLPKRMVTLLRSGVYRQTLLGNIGLIIGMALKKI